MITLSTVRTFRKALDVFLDAIEDDLGPDVQATTTPPARARQAPPKREPIVLPQSLATPKAGVVLADDVRAKSLPEATKVAVRILKMIGDSAQLVAGVTGQLALERIPYDAALVQQAIDAARQAI